MRTLLKTIVVPTPFFGDGESVTFTFYETPGTHPTPGGHEKYRLRAFGSFYSGDDPGSVMYSDSLEHLEEEVRLYQAAQGADQETFPSAIGWYADDGL